MRGLVNVANVAVVTTLIIFEQKSNEVGVRLIVQKRVAVAMGDAELMEEWLNWCKRLWFLTSNNRKQNMHGICTKVSYLASLFFFKYPVGVKVGEWGHCRENDGFLVKYCTR